MKKSMLLLMIALPLPAAAANGAALYKDHCAVCHGASGEGGTGATLRGKLKHSGAKSVFTVIKNGIPGTAMPAANGLTDADIKKLTSYVQSLRAKK